MTQDMCSAGKGLRRPGSRGGLGLVFVLLGVGVVIGLGCPPPDTTPPGNVTGLAATAGDGQVELAWTNPTDSDFAGVKIQRKTGGYPASDTDGITVYSGPGAVFLDKPLDNGTPYFYAAYAFDEVPNYASGVQATATPSSSLARADILSEYADIRDEIMGTISPEDRPPLLAALDDSETLYREGDICGAAGSIWGLLLPAVQAAREAARRAQCTNNVCVYNVEALYNRARMLRSNMVAGNPIGTSAKDQCPGAERVGLVADTAVDESANDNTQLSAVAQFGEPNVQTLTSDNTVYTALTIPGTFPMRDELGKPDVPRFRRLFAVPQGAEVSLTFQVTVAETINLNLYPVQQSPVDADPNQPPEASVFSKPPFTIDTAAYADDAPYPAVPCTVTDLGQSRDLRVFALDISTGQYQAASNALTLFKSVDVQLAFSGGGNFITSLSLGVFESNPGLYTGTVINHTALPKYVEQIPLPAFWGEELMILTPPSLLSAAKDLRTWKNKKGIATRIFQVGAGTAVTTNTAIQTLIQNEFNSVVIRPSYVLLLGDSDLIPTNYVTPYGNVGSSTIGTDYPYASFTGTLPDLAIGRIPVRTLADANVVVNKIIDYEKTPPVVASFYSNATIAGLFECCDLEMAFGTESRTFIRTAEFVRKVLIGDGKSVQRFYSKYVDPEYGTSDPTPRYLSDGTPLPVDLAPGSGFAWNGSTLDITNALNAGRFLVVHRDHGWPGGWWSPQFTASDAAGLTNSGLLPVVFSVNCASGLFDNETNGGALGTTSGGVYLAEALLRNPGGGAVGVLGDTRNSPSSDNSTLLEGFVDAVWPTAIPSFGDSTSYHRLGDILNHGKLYLNTQDGGSGDFGDELNLWHCIGDPTLEIWTRYPYPGLPIDLVSVLINAALVVNYPVNGAVVTALQADANGEYQPLGRGVVQDGEATLALLKTPVPGIPIQFSITTGTAPAVTVEQVVPNG